MADEPNANVEFPFALHETPLREARVLEDLLSTRVDLEYTEEFIAKSLELHGNPNILTSALFSAAHISYRRCFNRGVRGIVRSDLRQLSTKQRDTHAYHYAQANKLVAHSVNGFETVHVGIAVQDGKAVVGNVGFRLIGLDKPDLQEWLSLVQHIRVEILEPKIKIAYDQALERFRRIPISEIRGASVIKGAAPSKADASKKR